MINGSVFSYFQTNDDVINIVPLFWLLLLLFSKNQRGIFLSCRINEETNNYNND